MVTQRPHWCSSSDKAKDRDAQQARMELHLRSQAWLLQLPCTLTPHHSQVQKAPEVAKRQHPENLSVEVGQQRCGKHVQGTATRSLDWDLTINACHRWGFRRQPESPNGHILRSRPSKKTPPQFNEKTPGETQKERNGGGRGKKRANLGPPPFGAPPVGAPPIGAPTLLGPIFSRFGPHPLGP